MLGNRDNRDMGAISGLRVVTPVVKDRDGLSIVGNRNVSEFLPLPFPTLPHRAKVLVAEPSPAPRS